MLGDFNVHSQLWELDCPDEVDKANSKFADAVIDSPFTVLNDGSPTRIPMRSGDRFTSPDLSLATPKLAKGARWEPLDDPLSSDHLPITVTLFTSAALSGEAESRPNFQYNKADWERFRSILSATPISPTEDMETMLEEFTSNVMAAAHAAIPCSGGEARLRRHPWWNKDCLLAVRLKRDAYRTFRRTRRDEDYERMQEANRTCKRVVAEAKLQHWTAFVDSLGPKPDLTGAWKKVNAMRAIYKRPNPVIKDGDAIFTNDVEKAEAFADAFKQTSQQCYLPEEVAEMRADYERSHPQPDPVPDESAHFNAPLTMAELERALAGIKKLKVGAGPDCISYRMMRELPPSYKANLLHIYRLCWDQGRIPAVWKEAKIRPIPKKGKPRTSVDGYRPISLTSHVGKVMERMIQRRLSFHLESLRVIPCCQAGS